MSLALCSLVSLGCSSDEKKKGGIGGPNKCGEVAPCGGDLVGNWSIEGACVDPDAIENQDLDSFKQICPKLSYETSYEASGTASFTATTYTLDMDLNVTATVFVPKDCLMGLSCGELGLLFNQATGGDTGATISCTGSSDCHCAFVVPESQMETGSYTTSGTILTTTPTGGTADSTPYCVDGTTLHIITLASDAMTIVSDIIGKM
jgi:hypothetical protein